MKEGFFVMKKMSTLFIVFIALLTALSVIFKLYLGIPITFAGSYVKDINLSSVIIMFSGIMFGPLAGGIVGALTDIIVTLARPLGAYVPLFTITNALIGIIPALFFIKKRPEKISILKCFIITLVVQVTCSMFLNTVWQIIIGYMPFNWSLILAKRIIPSAILWPIFSVVLYLLTKAMSRISYKLPKY